MTVQLAHFAHEAFRGLSDNYIGNNRNKLFDFINYLNHVHSYTYVSNHGEGVYDSVGSLAHQYLTDCDEDEFIASRIQALELFFREGAIIEVDPGVRILVAHDGEGWSTEVERIGRYSHKDCWINQNDQKVFETSQVMELYEYILSKFDE